MSETSQAENRLTTLHLRHVSGGRLATVVIDSEGVIIDSSGFDENEGLNTVTGFAMNADDNSLDISTRFALHAGIQMAVGLIPLVSTDRGDSALLYFVVSAAETETKN